MVVASDISRTQSHSKVLDPLIVSVFSPSSLVLTEP